LNGRIAGRAKYGLFSIGRVFSTRVIWLSICSYPVSNGLAFQRIGSKSSVQGQNWFFIRFFVTFCAQKGLAVEKSNHFDTPVAAQKKLAPALVRACGPLDLRGSNSFLLLPPPGY